MIINLHTIGITQTRRLQSSYTSILLRRHRGSINGLILCCPTAGNQKLYSTKSLALGMYAHPLIEVVIHLIERLVPPSYLGSRGGSPLGVFGVVSCTRLFNLLASNSTRPSTHPYPPKFRAALSTKLRILDCSANNTTMTVSAAPEAVLSHLPRADGSATYSYAGYTITASANGPIEAQRRDEDPYRALVDVIVRPAAGVGGKRFRVLVHRTFNSRLTICSFSIYLGTRERHLESILESSLRQLILVNSFPRGLIQVVLQIRTTPENEYVNTKLVQAHLVS